MNPPISPNSLHIEDLAKANEEIYSNSEVSNSANNPPVNNASNVDSSKIAQNSHSPSITSKSLTDSKNDHSSAVVTGAAAVTTSQSAASEAVSRVVNEVTSVEQSSDKPCDNSNSKNGKPQCFICN